jgi:hypothetical protein
MRPISCVVLAVLLLLLGGCQSQQPPSAAYQVVQPPAFPPGSTIPTPTEPVVLTITGEIATTNAEQVVEFDLPTLEKLGLVEYTIKDPWLREEFTFRGVLMSDLLRYVGSSTDATRIKIIALDDYTAEVAISDLQKWPVLLATRVDGETMDPANHGPIRLIFPIHAYPAIDSAYDPLWVWSITRMEVR